MSKSRVRTWGRPASTTTTHPPGPEVERWPWRSLVPIGVDATDRTRYAVRALRPGRGTILVKPKMDGTPRMWRDDWQPADEQGNPVTED